MAGFFEDFITGGAASRNEAARAAVENQRKNIRANYEFEWGDPNSDELGGEALRKYDYAVEGLEILKRNTEKNIAFQEAEREQQYDYGMGIREYEHTQNMRAYDASVAGAVQQQSFNEIATAAALADQDRLLNEQLLSLAFDETESLLEYGAAAAGLGLKKRQVKTGAVAETQAQRISALKATGAAAARGVSGRSAGKQIQGMLAESGARQAAIIDEFMFNTEAVDTDFIRLNQQFAIDQVAFQTSRESARLTDMASRTKIAQQSLQAAMNAASNIMLKPEIAPPLPKPFALPRPEFQDIYKPKKPPMTTVADAAQENLLAAGFNTTIGLASTGLGIAKDIKYLGT
jgi:hypothetical protein